MSHHASYRVVQLCALLAVIGWSGSAFAAFSSDYTFSAGSGSGTATNMTGSTSIPVVSDDDGAMTGGTPLDIGFTFYFDGTAVTKFSVNSNGLIKLGGGTVVSGTRFNEDFPSFGPSGNDRPFLAPFWDDLYLKGNKIRRKLTGTSPNQVLTIEYHCEKYSFNNLENLVMQVRLYESTNVIEFYYDAFSVQPGANAFNGFIGAATSLTNYVRILPGATPQFLTSGSGTVTPPAAGTLYTMTPQRTALTGGDNQSATVTAAYAQPLAVSVTIGGTPVQNAAVTFTAPASGASGTFSNSTNTITVNTDSQGAASATFTANATNGAFTVTAAGPGGAVSFSLQNTTPTAQTITFGALPNRVLSATPVTLAATASSGLPVSFVLTAGSATLNGAALTCTGAGVVTVRAEQPGDGTFAAATAVEQSFTVYEVLAISSFSAGAATVKIGAAVTFSVAGNFSAAAATFDFGDGSSASGSSASYVYTSAGSYRVTVTLSDAASGQSATAALTVTVSADAPAEAPMVVAVKPVIRFRVQSGVVKLMERVSQSDSIAIKGVLHVPAGVTLEGQAVAVNIGGVTRTFVLDASGRAASGNAAFQMKVQQRNGVTLSSEAPFSLKLVGGSFAATMKACCPLHTNGLPSEIAITVGFNGQQIRNIQTMEFKGRGAAKTAKLGVEQSDLSR